MTDETIEDKKNADSNTPVDDKDIIIADLKSQHARMQAKLDELLSETKAAKQKAKKEAEEREAATRAKAEKEGDFQQLLKSSEDDRKKLFEELDGLRNKISSEKVKSESLKIAAELADGHNAELLSEFIKNRIKYTDEGVKVLDESGQLTVSSLDQLKQEFASSEKFKALIRGVKSNGGSAQGSGNSNPQIKEVNRSTFESWNPEKKSSFVTKDKGRVIDD